MTPNVRLVGGGGFAILNGISALIKVTQGAASSFLPCDVTVRRQPSMRKWVFPDSVILRFPASRLWGINVVYKPPVYAIFVVAA